METDLITRVNELQDIFASVGGGESVDLPQIVTVGSQSSGKSSVLENIVGRDFLPRGSGIVTRRPLVLQLVHLAPTSSIPPEKSAPIPSGYNIPSSSNHNEINLSKQQVNPREYAEFLHTHQRFYDFNEVRKEIENETKRVTGANKGISKLPIHLKLYSERVTNLTLVDLPGLTKIPVGDQPTDIERQIRSLVLDYISKPNCIILAISPANVDLANSDSLKLARTVDPEGRRTLGVLTKLDLMDNGTNAIEILTGRVYPLKLGFIGVVNRSQQDINTEKPMEDALASEEEFFKTHPAYRLIAHRCGTKFLTKTLNNTLLAHIRDRLPDLKARLNTLIGQTQQELSEYGDLAFMGDQNRGSHILSMINSFSKSFKDSIDGTLAEQSTVELVGGARILEIFDNRFGRALESINPMHNLSPRAIAISMKNSTGARPSLFMPETTFIQLIKPQIQLLEPPSLKCVDLVYEELMKFCHGCTSDELTRYPRLHAQIIEVVSEVLRERLRPTLDFVRSLIQIQMAYINTKHPMFTEMTASIMSNQVKQREQAANQRKRAIQEAAKKKGEGDDKSVSGDDEDALLHPEAKVNGRVTPQADGPLVHHKSRTQSTSMQDRNHARHVSAQSSISMSGRISPVPGSGAGQGHPAKDTFLNYFFGTATLPGASSSARRGGPLPDLSEVRSDNPLAGRRGLEGNAAAFDMRSLDKHIDASSMDEDALGLNDADNSSVPLLQSMITAYFSIVRQTIQDLVPKAIMHYLVNETTATVQTRLVEKLYQDKLFDDLLQEDENTAADRNRIKATLDAYKEAFRKLSDSL